MHTRVSLRRRPLGDLVAAAARAGTDGDVVVRDTDGRLHRMTLRGGRVVSLRIAGRFDPLLDLLRRRRAIDGDGFQAALEALAASERRSGDLAIERGGARADDVRATLADQARKRVEALFSIAEAQGHDAWVEPRSVSASEAATSLPYVDAVRGSRRARIVGRNVCGPTSTARAFATAGTLAAAGPTPPDDAAEARRSLRALARKLHPDLHPHLSDAERARLAMLLARATDAYHARTRR